MIIIVLSALAALASAMPSYIAVPADQIAFVDLTRLHARVPRQTLAPPPETYYQEEYQPIQYPIRNYHDDGDIEPIQQYAPRPRTLALAPQPPPVRMMPHQGDSAGAPSHHHEAPPYHEAPLHHQAGAPSHHHEAPPYHEAPQHHPTGAPSHPRDAPPDFGEYVDFGAHTGDHGSFGWYADYPVNRDTSE